MQTALGFATCSMQQLFHYALPDPLSDFFRKKLWVRRMESTSQRLRHGSWAAAGWLTLLAAVFSHTFIFLFLLIFFSLLMHSLCNFLAHDFTVDSCHATQWRTEQSQWESWRMCECWRTVTGPGLCAARTWRWEQSTSCCVLLHGAPDWAVKLPCPRCDGTKHLLTFPRRLLGL